MSHGLQHIGTKGQAYQRSLRLGSDMSGSWTSINTDRPVNGEVNPFEPCGVGDSGTTF